MTKAKTPSSSQTQTHQNMFLTGGEITWISQTFLIKWSSHSFYIWLETHLGYLSTSKLKFTLNELIKERATHEQGKHNVTGHPLGIFLQTGTVGTIRTRPIFPFILLSVQSQLWFNTRLLFQARHKEVQAGAVASLTLTKTAFMWPHNLLRTVEEKESLRNHPEPLRRVSRQLLKL